MTITLMEEFPPGFRFYPTEEELVSFYLHKKLQGNGVELNRVIPVVPAFELEPWDLPKLSGELCRGDPEQWFFFVPRQEREARGGRPNRTTGSGYWKATGSPSYVYSSNNKVIGVKKTMVFYKGKAPSGRNTNWKMNEYRAIEEELAIPSTCVVPIPKLRHELSLCRVYVTSGSFRAFDRRPLGTATRETVDQQPNNTNGVASSSHNTTNPVVEKTSSPESSYSGEKDLVDLMENVGNTSWEVGNGIEPLWEWEQLNWL